MSTGPPHLAHLDDLRTILVAWVIGGHALLGYSAVGGWAYDEVRETTFAPSLELLLVAVLGPSGLFVIGLFFFVVGLFVERAVRPRRPPVERSRRRSRDRRDRGQLVRRPSRVPGPQRPAR